MKAKAGILILLFLFSAELAGILAATDEGYGEDSAALGQFVDSFEDLDNVSIAFEVIRNSTLNAMELNFSGTFPDYIDLTTFTEVDPGNDMTVTASRNTWVQMPRNVNNYLYYDFGVGFLDDWYYEFNFSISDVEAGDASNAGIMSVISVTNILGNVIVMRTGTDIMLQLIQDGSNDDKFKFAFYEYSGGVFQGGQLSGIYNIGIYYMIFDRSGTLSRLRIYSDKEHTALLDTLQYAASGDDNYRYLQVVTSFGGVSDPNDHSSGYVEDVWNLTMVDGFASSGYFTTVDYLSDPFANGSALVAMLNTTIPANTQILVEFSEDNSTWVFNDWAPLSGGFESVDLRDLNYSSGYHTRFNLSTSDSSVTPRVHQNRVITTIGNASIITEIQNVSGAWVKYNLTEFNASVGTVDAGLLSSTFFIDGIMFNVSEVVGVPGMMLSGNFTGVDEDAISLWLLVYAQYDGNLNHDFDIEFWDFESSAWVEDEHITDVLELTWFNSTIYRLRIPARFLRNGEVRIRFDHESPGNINHDLMIDQIQLQAFIPSAAADEPFQFFWIVIGIALMIIGIVLSKMWPEEGDP